MSLVERPDVTISAVVDSLNCGLKHVEALDYAYTQFHYVCRVLVDFLKLKQIYCVKVHGTLTDTVA